MEVKKLAFESCNVACHSLTANFRTLNKLFLFEGNSYFLEYFFVNFHIKNENIQSKQAGVILSYSRHISTESELHEFIYLDSVVS